MVNQSIDEWQRGMRRESEDWIQTMTICLLMMMEGCERKMHGSDIEERKRSIQLHSGPKGGAVQQNVTRLDSPLLFLPDSSSLTLFFWYFSSLVSWYFFFSFLKRRKIREKDTEEKMKEIKWIVILNLRSTVNRDYFRMEGRDTPPLMLDTWYFTLDAWYLHLMLDAWFTPHSNHFMPMTMNGKSWRKTNSCRWHL